MYSGICRRLVFLTFLTVASSARAATPVISENIHCVVRTSAQVIPGATADHGPITQLAEQGHELAPTTDSGERLAPLGRNGANKTEQPAPPFGNDSEGPRFSFGIRAAFSLPENDLRLTTGSLPSFAVGAYGQFLIRRGHRLRPVGEWWHFSAGRQTIQTSSQAQTIDTKVSAMLVGGEYLYGLKGFAHRFSVGGGLYLVRWSIDSVNNLTLVAGGSAKASGNSQWNRVGEGPVASFQFSRHLDIQGRWVRSNYGYEHIPVNVVTLGAGWSF